ncbi:MAG: hypothetical protein K6E97_09250 [Treponema sp.]|nr:hypothetical protein [Treponema sp.]
MRSNEADSGTAESPVFAPGKNGPIFRIQKNPSKDGKVTGGTISSVKINGKETAVIGSTVTTCNDVGAQNNSTIISPGASIPMPSIINPLNTEEYKKERDKDKKEPGFETVKWASASVNENEEAELSASVKDIEDDNMVTLQVFPEGKGPEDGAAIASFPCKVVNGSVSAKWKYKGNDREVPPDDDPKFVFSAHSAWCNFKKSSNTLTVKLIRPEVTKAEWKDEDGNSLSSALVGQPLKLCAEVKNVEDGQGVTFEVYDENLKQVFSEGAKVEGGKAEAEWVYHWDGIKLDHKPKFTFKVTGARCKENESGELEVSGRIEIYLKPLIKIDLNKNKFCLTGPDDYKEDLSFDNNKYCKKEDLIPNKYYVILENKNE